MAQSEVVLLTLIFLSSSQAQLQRHVDASHPSQRMIQFKLSK